MYDTIILARLIKQTFIPIVSQEHKVHYSESKYIVRRCYYY